MDKNLFEKSCLSSVLKEREPDKFRGTIFESVIDAIFPIDGSTER